MSNIKNLTPEAFQIDAQDWCKQIETFISDKFSLSYRDRIVVPISGGLDSSVVATLCTRAIGKEKVIGLMLPERFGNPEANYYGQLIAKHLDIKTMKINISPILKGLGTSNLFLSAISGREFWRDIANWFLQKRNQTAKILYIDALKGQLNPTSRELIAQVNSKQRARLLATYRIADEYNLMVAGSSHKTEQMVGLFVKYGIDDCADIMPLKNIYRSQILQLAEYIKIPPEILRRSPNPDILPGITDKYQGYFGIDYLKVELILLGMQMELSTDEIARQLGLDDQTVIQMFEIVQLSENSRSHALAPELK
ncbi:MAG TPA: NAD(+) synthase [Clostridiales bacterium]|nr:NAD(+) synthase [Clostridiales bacterium]